MELMFFGLDLGEVREAVVEGGLKLSVLGLELGELGGEGEVLLLEERAGLLGGDGGGVGLSPHGVDLLVQLADERVGLLRHRNGVIRVPRELLLRQEERHFWQFDTLISTIGVSDGDILESIKRESEKIEEGKVNNLKGRGDSEEMPYICF